MRAIRYTHRPDSGNNDRLRWRTGRLWPCLALLLCCLNPHPALARDPAPETPTASASLQINRLAAALVDAPEAMRADFAVAAIAEMIVDYNAEADLARREARTHARDHDLERWAAAVDAYAAELTSIANSVAPDTPVRVAIGTGNNISLEIDGTPVLVSSPRVREESAFEQRVLDRFCNLYPCDDLIAEYRPPQPVAATSSSEIHWSFSQQAGPSCSTGDGLEFQFQDMTDIGRKRAACERVIKELNVLAQAITARLSYGSRIDWNRLSIRSLPGEEEQQVELAGAGSSIRLPLAALSETTRLFELVRPWLAAKVAGQSEYRLVVINAGSLMAPLIDSSGYPEVMP
jgi:hypothetical protein